jgi:trimeric autotransporter adhesin
MSFLTANTQSSPGVFFFLSNPVSYLSISPSNSNVPPNKAGEVQLTNVGGNLNINGVAVNSPSNWSLYPAISNRLYMDSSNVLSNIGGNLYFNNNLLAQAGDISNVADWSLYAQLCNVDGNGKSISNNSGLSSTGVISTSSNIQTPVLSNSSGLTITADTISNTATGITNVVDRGADIGGNATYSITAQNGTRGIINLTTNAGFSNGSNSEINLTANGGVVDIGEGYTLARGGLITLTANTPVGSNITLTSAIKLSAASILSYAGAFSPFLSLAGYNYIYGQGGVNITSTLLPPSVTVPNTALSVYISGDAGTKIRNGLYVDNINNLYGSNLVIQTPVFSGSNASISMVSSSNISLTAESVPSATTSIKGNTMYLYGSNSSIQQTSSGDINVNPGPSRTLTLNGNTTISNGTLNLSNNNITNVVNISNTSTNLNLSAGANTINVTSVLNMSSYIDMNENGVYNTTSVSSPIGSNLTILASSGGLLSLGAPAGTITLSSPTTTVTNDFVRRLVGSNVSQPIIQYGSFTGTGSSGSNTVTFTAYTSATSYIVIGSMMDNAPARMSAVRVSSNSATIYWEQAGGGTQTICWTTMGN